MLLTNQDEKYTVSLELFEGPLDLLLYLIRKNEVDIYDIPINTITDQYLKYLSVIRELNLNNVGEFILLASQLLYIKSQMLLPEEERGEMEEFEDPRMELVLQLLEYRKFKNAALSLDAMQREEAKRFPRFAQIVFDEASEDNLPALDASVFDLLEAFSGILQSRKLPQLDIEGETVTVADKILELRERLALEQRISFSEIFASARTRMELLCAFLALLELIKLGEARAAQESKFGEIIIERGANGHA